MSEEISARAAAGRAAHARATALRTTIDIGSFIRAAGDASPDLRTKAAQVHAFEHESDDEVRRCSVILLAPKALEKLKAILGRDAPSDEALSVYVRWSTPAEREPVDSELRRLLRRRVLDAIHPIGVEITRKVIATMQADLEILMQANADIHARYGFAPDGGLVSALRATIKHLSDEAAAPVDYTSGIDIRLVASRWFSTPIDEIPAPPALDLARLTAAVAAAAAPESAAPDGALRSAADVAAARAG